MPETKKNPARSSICLIRWWFGEFPAYMDCVLRSCAANPDIDWLLLTDNPSRKNFPPNVRAHSINFVQLRELLSKKLDFTVNLSRSDSLTVFKPALGICFEELLNGYDFWGCCDLDMIFGDLRKFLREEILAAHDKILCRGHLTLFRNTEKVNRYFTLDCPGVPGYREIFQSGKPFQFDEWRGIYLILRYHNIPQFHDEFIADIAPPTKWKITRFETTFGQNFPEQVFYWHKGKIFRARYNCDCGIVDDEYAYIHFQKRALPAPQFDPFSVNGFFITPDGFFPYDREPLTDEDFAKYNRARWRPFGEIMSGRWRGLKRRLGLSPRL